MSKKTNDIADNEIRIISAYEPKKRQRNRFIRAYLPIIVAVLLVVVIVVVFFLSANENQMGKAVPSQNGQIENQPIIESKEAVANVKGRILVVDTIINKKGLQIFCPTNLRPRLVVGNDKLNDSTIVFATQAADVRRDNGQIAGIFVMKGEVIGKGEAKAGFCSIINDELTIGISDATPMLEHSLTEDGYFFRQYPLVVGGQIVENKPKGKAIRKALAEIDGKICVIMSKEKLTFHEFSQLLIDVRVRNAIYLVGSSSYGFYINENGDKILTGISPKTDVENVNYIIWE